MAHTGEVHSISTRRPSSTGMAATTRRKSSRLRSSGGSRVLPTAIPPDRGCDRRQSPSRVREVPQAFVGFPRALADIRPGLDRPSSTAPSIARAAAEADSDGARFRRAPAVRGARKARSMTFAGSCPADRSEYLTLDGARRSVCDPASPTSVIPSNLTARHLAVAVHCSAASLTSAEAGCPPSSALIVMTALLQLLPLVSLGPSKCPAGFLTLLATLANPGSGSMSQEGNARPSGPAVARISRRRTPYGLRTRPRT
jgi:hypothetical protein